MSPQLTNVSQVETLLEESPSQSPTQPLLPADQEPVSVEWTNYTSGKLEQRTLQESITFTIRNYGSELVEIFLRGSTDRSMKSIQFREKVESWLNGHVGSVPLKYLADMKKGIWYFQICLKTRDGEIVSELREIEIVGQ